MFLEIVAFNRRSQVLIMVFKGLAAQNREKHPHLEAWIRDMIAYIAPADVEQGRKLLSQVAVPTA